MNLVYPRLPTAHAMTLLQERSSLTTDELRARSDNQHPRSEWYPTAAHRVSRDDLTALQSRIREIAEMHGHPKIPGRRANKYIDFDRALTAEIVPAMKIVPADAAHEGVWSFLSLVLLPDVALWRYPNPSGKGDYERIIGRPRNVFRRLWWRAVALGPETSSMLHEDEAVAIMERPSLGGDPRLARCLAETHLQVAADNSGVSRTELMRQVTKRLRRVSVIVTLAALDDDALARQVREIFDESLDALENA